MKVRIECNNEDYTRIRKLFEDNGFEICNNAKFLFSEIGFKSENVTAYDNDGVKHYINLSEVVLIESSEYKNVLKNIDGSSLFVHDNLYYFESRQFNHTLIRINKSQVINYKLIKKVSALVNSRLKLTMRSNEVVYITRTYIREFKNKFR